VLLHKPDSQTWFEKSVQELVLRPSSRPELVLAYAGPELQLRTLHLSDEQVWNPQVGHVAS
jgi:hypothetical protein